MFEGYDFVCVWWVWASIQPLYILSKVTGKNVFSEITIEVFRLLLLSLSTTEMHSRPWNASSFGELVVLELMLRVNSVARSCIVQDNSYSLKESDLYPHCHYKTFSQTLLPCKSHLTNKTICKSGWIFSFNLRKLSKSQGNEIRPDLAALKK